MAIAIMLAALIAATPASAQDCQSALGPLHDGPEESALPGQIDGASLAGAEALVALRRERGDALIVVRGGDFSGADLRGAQLHNICFLDSKFANSDWRGARAPGIGFIRADLTGANLAGARMPRIQLRNSLLVEAHAERADFSGGRLDGGWWDGNAENLRLDGANLSFFRFECGITLDDGCPITGEIRAPGVDLTGAALSGFHLLRDISGARIDRTEIHPDQLQDLSVAALAGPIRLRGGESVAELSPAEYLFLLPLIRQPGEAPQPSFDCARAASAVERRICGENGATLRALDVSVARLYRQALARDSGVEASQRAWLGERDRCLAESSHDSWCLETAYERRREALVAALGRPAWLTPGAIAMFVGPVIDFDPGFYADPLYRRLLPVLVGASWSRVLVRANGDGTIDARGDAVGANAHLCSLSGDRLVFDRSSGWFSGPYQANPQDPADWRDRPMPVLLFWDDRAQVYQHGRSSAGESGDPRFSDYASCGMRASFGNLIRVPMSQEDAGRLFESYGEGD